MITGLSGVKAEVLVIGISSDWLYPPYQSQEIVTALRANGLKAFYGEIRSNYGHDAFLLEQGQLNYLLKSFLDQASAGDVMSRAVHTIREDTTIEKAAELMIHLETNHLPVVSHDDRLIGIVTSWDIAKAVARGLHDLREITTSPVVTTTLDEPVEEAVRKMEDNGISALPVVDRDNRVIGIVTNESMSYMLNKCR